jgi:hypothetical protein
MTDGQLKTFEVPVIGISISAVLDKAQQRSMVFQTHFPQDAKSHEINAVLKTCCEVMEQQHDAFKYVELQREMEVLKKTIAEAQISMAKVDDTLRQKWLTDGRRGPPKPTQQEAATRSHVVSNIEHSKREIAWADEQLKILQGRLKAGLNGAASTSNR